MLLLYLRLNLRIREKPFNAGYEKGKKSNILTIRQTIVTPLFFYHQFATL